MAQWQRFHLTTGEEIAVPTTMGGESWEWLGQCSYEELGMVNQDDDSLNIKCTTVHADEVARMVNALYDAQHNRPDQDQDDERDIDGELWEAFCEAKTLAKFQRTAKRILKV